MGIQSRVCLFVFDLAFVRCFLIMLPSLHFRIVIYILCHYMLHVCDLLFDFVLWESAVKKLHDSQKRLWTFKNG